MVDENNNINADNTENIENTDEENNTINNSDNSGNEGNSDENGDNTSNTDTNNTDANVNTDSVPFNIDIEKLGGKLPIYLNTVKILDEITSIDNKFGKIEEVIEENNTLLKYIQNIIEQFAENMNPPVIDEDATIKQQIINKLKEGARFADILNDLKQILIIDGIYDSRYVLLKIYTDNRTEDTILVVKLRPNPRLGEIISFFYDEFGEPYKFITSDYKMRIILKYKLITHMQMDEFEDTSGIVEQVTEEWGDSDDIRNP